MRYWRTMITILRDRKRLIRWSKPLFRTHSLQFSTTSKGYLQTASILGNFEGGDILWEDLVKLTTCDRSSIKDRTLDVVARGSGNQSTLWETYATLVGAPTLTVSHLI